ncbi:MAG: hypothetical protein A3E36_00040 [Candidatus Andersenbacteria bacterium RIFCSPHIGHO2_12_FULL_45_11b]|uniref:J domain-containing protein n=1 Tax=Candidatus Andersenbacteria bacterium RIFCSPHIGHO2_12_FULL_45_11b TaxID=1797282 RepID=A0A1G1X6P4_9BACT|nr:MAG: hypothetical protein A3E36_00040 [Candidatus Andersenbacteria bacterium RIFCSPHIGHO2_12_FULL_45_11b]
MNNDLWYEVLGVSEDASDKEVRNARDKLARRYLKEGDIAKLTAVNDVYHSFKRRIPSNEFDGAGSWQGYNQRTGVWRQILKQIMFFVLTLVLVPLSMGLWAIHPLLGILGIVFFMWLVKNKWTTEYYFG